jgi:Nif-specific regulatory protein
VKRLRQERDLYARLLSLGTREDLEPFLEEALALVVEVTDSDQGFLEVRAADAEEGEPSWWMAHACSSAEIDDIRRATSRGIIAEALATGETVVTPSATLDPRFRDRGSVREGRIGAVLCAPIGGTAALGVLYLQRGNGTFSEESRARAEVFARHLAPLADRLLVRRRVRHRSDPTQPHRAKLRLEGVVGHSAALAEVLRLAALVAPLDVNVLLTGDSGTGKSQLARVIHQSGPRAARPFVELNCAALPESLVESELFGALPGAHSTAQRALPGKVAAAEGGTLFLDEVTELPAPAQAKLLQLLQSRTYYPLGASRPVQADVRLIAATNTDLEEAVREKRFREDLFYRLQVLPIRLPGLAARVEDLPELAAHLVERASERHRLPRLALSPGARDAILAAEWPGNVRQLAHALEAATIRAAGEGAARIERRHVFPESGARGPQGDEGTTFQEATRRFQRDLLRRVLDETAWNVSEVARRLDLARSHVYTLIKACGLERGRS